MLKLQYVDVKSKDDFLSYIRRANLSIAFLDLKSSRRVSRVSAVYVDSERTVYVLLMGFNHNREFLERYVLSVVYDHYSTYLRHYRMLLRMSRIISVKMYDELMREQDSIARELLQKMRREAMKV